MPDTIIPAGYRVTVSSWENDGDNYKTEVIEGLSKPHLLFVLDACELLKDGCNNPNCYGNKYDESDEDLEEALDELILEHPDRPPYSDNGRDVIENLLSDLGLTLSGEYTTRVFESAKIEFVENPIIIKQVTRSDLF